MSGIAASGPAAQSFYERVLNKLDTASAAVFEKLFDDHEIRDERGRNFRVGRVVRDAWSQEFDLPESVVNDAAALVSCIAQGKDLSSYAMPTCCLYHGKLAHLSFADPAARPREKEQLGVVIQALWALLPHARGVFAMDCPTPQRESTSRFMVLDYFIERHDAAVLRGSVSPGGPQPEYALKYHASRAPALRQADLRAAIKAGALIGMVGGFPDGARPTPSYCDQRRPFSTPTRNIDAATRSTAPPEGVLGRLGLQFESGKTFVELVYTASIRSSTASAPAARRAMIPTVLDAEGYWLFRPDRCDDRKTRLKWNYTRDVSTNGRGHEELIFPSVAIAELTDLIVWPRKTGNNWSKTAAPALTHGSYATP